MKLRFPFVFRSTHEKVVHAKAALGHELKQTHNMLSHKDRETEALREELNMADRTIISLASRRKD